MDVLVRAIAAIIVAFSAVTSSGVLQPGIDNGVSVIHASPIPDFGMSVKGVEAFRGTPRPDPSAKPSGTSGVAGKKAGPQPGTPSPARTAKPVRRVGVGTSGSATAKAYAAARLSAVQFHCLDLLWTRESHWNHRLLYAPTGAYGIPQAVPGRKMAAAGADWRTNPITQVRWGLGYIRARYGTPCIAWAHSERTGWY